MNLMVLPRMKQILTAACGMGGGLFEKKLKQKFKFWYIHFDFNS